MAGNGRAKQSQSVAGELPVGISQHSHYSSIPLFQHSNPMPIMRNKPKLGQDGSSGGQCAEEAIVRNKANLRQRESKDKCFMHKGLGQTGYAPRLGKTKPIWGGVSSSKFQVLRRAGPWSGLHTSHFTLQTRPKAVRAKQSQFPEAGGRGNPPPSFGRSPVPCRRDEVLTWRGTGC